MTFNELYDAHFAFVGRSLRRLGVPDSDLGDALQEVFLVVYRKLPEFEGRAKITTWLFRIAMGVARDRARRAHVRREVFGASELETLSQGARQEEDLQRREDLQMIDRALSRLGWDQRTVFVLFELEGLGGEEIAETLGIPLGTVHSRLRLARAAFQRAIAAAAAERDRPLRAVKETSP